MQANLSVADAIHSRAIEVSTRYKRAEAELLDIIQRVEDHRVFIERGHTSLFSYVVSELGLSESVALCLITVARKARMVPELKAELQKGAITISNARRIAAVITPENQSEWLMKASALTSRQLEKEIVQVRPAEATPERASYVAPDRIKLQLGLSERDMLELRRVQDVMSQSRRRAVSLEEAVRTMSAEYLRRHDPVEKAKRSVVRRGAGPGIAQVTLAAQTQAQTETGTKNPTVAVKTLVTKRVVGQREPIPAWILHQVNLRDQRRCTHVLPDGRRCNQARWIEIHHKIPVSQGGSNALENLITLCSAHHKYAHLNT
jgi:hypothetical protein